MSMALILRNAKLFKQNIVYGSGQHKSVTTKKQSVAMPKCIWYC